VVVEDEQKDKKHKTEKGTIEKVKAAIKAKVGEKKPEKTKKGDSDEEEIILKKEEAPPPSDLK
jgi:hypothetical protein